MAWRMVANPPFKDVTATPYFAHSFGVLADFKFRHKQSLISAKQKSRNLSAPAFFESSFETYAAVSPTWKRTKWRMVISSPSCLLICATCSLTLTSELRFTKPWSTRQ